MAPQYDQDHIYLKNITFFAHHGVYEHETREGQHFVLSAKLFTDQEKAGRSDALEDTVDYGAVAKFMVRFLTDHTYQLLECAAQQVLEATLCRFEKIRAIELTLEKPEAPMKLDFETVAVNRTMGWHKVYLGIGSNIGDSKELLEEALRKIGEHPLCRELRASSFITTKPYGYTDQPDFLNCAAELETLLSPRALLAFLHEAEQEAGRERTVRWGPRTLDLDILFYDDLVLDSEDLTIPHVDLHNRRFVLEPMAELAPFLRHPLRGETVAQMLERLER